MEGGERRCPDDEIVAEITRGIGAVVMGRKMFSGGAGPGRATRTPTAWWGDDPPFHAPVFVLTHHEREPLVKQGGTTFHFVTDGIGSALEQARAAAGDRTSRWPAAPPSPSSTWRPACSTSSSCTSCPSCWAAAFASSTAPSPAPVELEAERVVASPAVTHLRFRVAR